jgi:hypothetical protein
MAKSEIFVGSAQFPDFGPLGSGDDTWFTANDISPE